SHFARSEHAESVELPAATLGQEDADPAPFRLTVTISEAGEFSVAGERRPEAVILRQIEQLQREATAAGVTPQLRIRAARDGNYGPMRRLIEHSARCGVRSLQFAVQQPGE
ncbi:MAG: hypothetical protein KDA89_01805, partial [Planctomycetaceae bacterium]|nr:hypothetical protein [Planctomycetaceae bacterium]